APDEVLRLCAQKHLGPADVEAALRAGRASYPAPPQPPGKLTRGLPLPCDHVDHRTEYHLYVPKSYDPARRTPLLCVVHGGSAARDLAFGARAARSGYDPFWIEQAETNGWLLLAPLTDRGWMHLGNSILFSAISRVQRDYHVDPDRVYLTGHSMGGHMTWRSAFQFPDRFAAVSPMSGGYDYVASEHVWNLANVPGYTTWGEQEPYDINPFNKKIAAWLEAHDYGWTCREKPGGHTIFADEVPKVAAFFAAHPRDLYRRQLWARFGATPLQFDTAEKNEAWGVEHRWDPARPIAASTVHWLRGVAREADVPQEQRIMKVHARIGDGNRIEITAEHARRLRLYLHPKLVDFARSVVVVANGEKVFDGKVAPDVATMLQLAREFDDRGRVFWAAVDVAIAGDRSPGEPSGRR
ncbi:MAG: hypothetical protein FJ265_17185, partial [Planctomycetes bacterium]|nr:hypothetical protein [Planctomycetota bacterium]